MPLINGRSFNANAIPDLVRAYAQIKAPSAF
jgi:hypothetical protein